MLNVCLLVIFTRFRQIYEKQENNFEKSHSVIGSKKNVFVLYTAQAHAFPFDYLQNRNGKTKKKTIPCVHNAQCITHTHTHNNCWCYVRFVSFTAAQNLTYNGIKIHEPNRITITVQIWSQGGKDC